MRPISPKIGPCIAAFEDSSRRRPVGEHCGAFTGRPYARLRKYPIIIPARTDRLPLSCI